MPQQNLRSLLRTHTSDVHKRLDDTVGDLSTAEAYKAFVSRSYVFRSAVEPSIRAHQNWIPLTLVGALRDDVADLGGGLVDMPVLEPASNWSANLGRLYVLEGSSVGAKLLYRRALALGFTSSHGARHLALQANDAARWRHFLSLLDAVEGADLDEALSGAQGLFEFAFYVYSGRLVVDQPNAE